MTPEELERAVGYRGTNNIWRDSGWEFSRTGDRHPSKDTRSSNNSQVRKINSHPELIILLNGQTPKT